MTFSFSSEEGGNNDNFYMYISTFFWQKVGLAATLMRMAVKSSIPSVGYLPSTDVHVGSSSQMCSLFCVHVNG